MCLYKMLILLLLDKVLSLVCNKKQYPVYPVPKGFLRNYPVRFLLLHRTNDTIEEIFDFILL